MKKIVFICILLVLLSACKQKVEVPSFQFNHGLYHLDEHDTENNIYIFVSEQGTITINEVIKEDEYTIIYNNEQYIIKGNNAQYTLTYPDSTVFTCNNGTCYSISTPNEVMQAIPTEFLHIYNFLFGIEEVTDENSSELRFRDIAGSAGISLLTFGMLLIYMYKLVAMKEESLLKHEKTYEIVRIVGLVSFFFAFISFFIMFLCYL